jgi:DNA end-binding protein Ku
LIDPVTGNEQSRKRVFVDSTTGEIVPREKRLRVRKGPDGQAELAVAGTMIEIVTLRQRADVDDLYLEDQYYLVPCGSGVRCDNFGIIATWMKREAVVGLGNIKFKNAHRLLMIQPRGKGMLATTLRSPAEVRDETRYFSNVPDIEIPSDKLDHVSKMLKDNLSFGWPTPSAFGLIVPALSNRLIIEGDTIQLRPLN